jgi:glutamate-1-semialdehyde 2,1-aminomutase
MQFQNSRGLLDRARQTCPGGIHSNVRAAWQPHAMFYDHGKDGRVWDVDGNEFIDYVLARGPLLLGHSPKPVLDAVKAQLDRGLMFAGQHVLEVEASERMSKLVPCAEMVRFGCSGSEAVHAAIRLARAVTGRPKIVRFEGHYHGWYDNIFWSSAPPLDKAGPREEPVPVASTRGQSACDAQNLVVLPWNDLAAVKHAFERCGSEIAGILTEPIMCNTGGILPEPGYLEGLRELCTRHGALLIFDEIITGFRVALGGAQAHFGVTPDLATFAKALAGGFPVSAVAGKRQYMRSFGDLSVSHAGTYNAGAPSMAATVAALDMLSADNGAALQHAHRMGDRLRTGIAEIARKAGKKTTIRGLAPAFHVSFNETGPVTDYRSYAAYDRSVYGRFWAALQDRGVRTIPGGLWFVSTAHTERDVDQTLAAVEEAIREV